jgi:hypothetical protein
MIDLPSTYCQLSTPASTPWWGLSALGPLQPISSIHLSSLWIGSHHWTVDFVLAFKWDSCWRIECPLGIGRQLTPPSVEPDPDALFNVVDSYAQKNQYSTTAQNYRCSISLTEEDLRMSLRRGVWIFRRWPQTTLRIGYDLDSAFQEL